SFEIRFYIPANVGTLQGGVYTVSGSPFVTYKFESGTSALKITEQRNSNNYVNDITYNSSTATWSLQTGLSPDLRTLTRAIVLPTSTNRTETLEIKNASGVSAYKAVEEYQDEWGSVPYVLRTLTLNPGSSQLLTSYEYYTNANATPSE